MPGRMGPSWRELQATAMPISSLYHPFRQPRAITRGQVGRHRPHRSRRGWPRSDFQKSTSDGSYCHHYLWKIQSATEALPGLEIWEGVCMEDQRWTYQRSGCVKNHFTEPSFLATTAYWKIQVHCTSYVTFELNLSPRLWDGFRMGGNHLCEESCALY